MGDHAEDALDMEIEVFLNECEFGEGYELDWPISDCFGGFIPQVKPTKGARKGNSFVSRGKLGR